MNHVFVLTATNHRVPRWFAEGLAVHEEGQGNPRWSQPPDARRVVALKEKKLLPIAQLDRGFVRPEYPEQVLVSYYQAGRICDYIQEPLGRGQAGRDGARVRRGQPTPDVIQQALGLAPEAVRRAVPGLAVPGRRGQSSPAFDEWRTAHEEHGGAGSTRANTTRRSRTAKRCAACIPSTWRTLNPYQFLSRDRRQAKGDKPAALAVLADYRKFGGEDPATLKKLASLQEESGPVRGRRRDAGRASTRSTR